VLLREAQLLTQIEQIQAWLLVAGAEQEIANLQDELEQAPKVREIRITRC